MKKSLIAFIANNNLQVSDIQAQLDHLDQDLRLNDTLVNVTGFNQTLEYLANNSSPKLLLVDISSIQENRDLSIQVALQQLAEVCEPGTKVILLGLEISIDQYRQLINSGIEQYLTLPLSYDSLIDSVKPALGFASFKRKNNSKQVVISGLQGGVGSTTLTAALSLKLADHGNHTLLANIDTELGDLELFWPNLEQQTISSNQLQEMNNVERASLSLSDRLNYLPIKLSNDENIPAIQEKLSEQASTILWDIPRHHPLASSFWQQADVCIWVLESSVSALKHWSSIKENLENNVSEGSHQRHIFVLNQTRKERAQQISIDALEKAMQQSLVVLPYAGQQALDAANLGKAELLLKGKFGQGIEEICASIQIRSKSNTSSQSALQQLLSPILLPLKKRKPKKVVQ